jgi:chemotaxis protein methyltransferase CheR
MNKITSHEFGVLTKYIHDISGILIDTHKSYLLETRLGLLAEELGCRSYGELYEKALTDSSKSVKEKIIDAISTNETLFFRDSAPFDLLQHKILPELIDLRTASDSGFAPIPIRIWSAACSTGQEVYSIAIVLKELLPDHLNYNIKLIGTDISDAAIAQASYGQYNKFEIGRGLTPKKLQAYFKEDGNTWKVKDAIRAMVNFTKLNLMQPFESLGKFDVIFCRNVAIYFSLQDRKSLFDRLANMLDAGGSLIIGSSESLTGICSRFEPLRHLRTVFYRLKA